MIELKCPICKGTGMVKEVVFDDHASLTPCDQCDGTGTVELNNEYDLFDLLKVEYD